MIGDMKKFVSWRRVSTKKQGRSGLGLEAQKEIIDYFVSAEKGTLIADYCEVYTGTELSNCVELRKAIIHAKTHGATLIIAKSDRFRNTIEALQVVEEMGEGNIMFCDLPNTDTFTLTLFFALAQREALITSIRTKQALAAKKARGESWDRKGSKTIQKAQEASAKTRKIEAENDNENLFFKNYVEDFENEYGKLEKGCDSSLYDKLAQKLNKLGKKTATGLEYTSNRCRSLVCVMKKRYYQKTQSS